MGSLIEEFLSWDLETRITVSLAAFMAIIAAVRLIVELIRRGRNVIQKSKVVHEKIIIIINNNAYPIERHEEIPQKHPRELRLAPEYEKRTQHPHDLAQKGSVSQNAEVIEESRDAVERRAEAYFQRGLIEKTEVRWRDAQRYYDESVKLAPDGKRLNAAASIHWLLGDYYRAEPLYEEALAIRKKALGDEHPDYAASLNNLAALLEATGRYEEAEPMFREALAIRKKALGDEHPDYAASLNNLAALLEATGRYKEAEPLYEEALAVTKKTLGEEHPNYAASLNNLAGLLKAAGRSEEAEPPLREALAIHKKVLERNILIMPTLSIIWRHFWRPPGVMKRPSRCMRRRLLFIRRFWERNILVMPLPSIIWRHFWRPPGVLKRPSRCMRRRLL